MLGWMIWREDCPKRRHGVREGNRFIIVQSFNGQRLARLKGAHDLIAEGLRCAPAQAGGEDQR